MEINKVELTNVHQITSKKCYTHLSKLHQTHMQKFPQVQIQVHDEQLYPNFH